MDALTIFNLVMLSSLFSLVCILWSDVRCSVRKWDHMLFSNTGLHRRSKLRPLTLGSTAEEKLHSVLSLLSPIVREAQLDCKLGHALTGN